MYITQVSRIPRATGDILLIVDNYGKLYVSKDALNAIEDFEGFIKSSCFPIEISAVEINVTVLSTGKKPKAAPKPGPGKKRK